MISENVLLWVGFNVIVLIMLAIDLGVFHRREHEVSIREALAWTAVWVALALTFNVVIYFWRGGEVALEFLTGYVIEKSLSVDNIFVFLLIFTYFGIAPIHQHRILFWGILGALVLRAMFIFAGVGLIQKFHWVIYVFGGFLIITGIKMAFQKDKELHPERNPVLRLFKRFFPVTDRYEGGRFFITENGRRLATPLFIVL
ncbi:MAG: TerC/Alx family metal homeostasis membrane protein, partial [Planctomycetota bacterium]|nr:TerC/Alx family metal homeostasis membrane protein [Planctomycetota bacterium]